MIKTGWVWFVVTLLSYGIQDVQGNNLKPGDLHTSLAHMEALFTFDKQVGELLLRFPEHIPAATSYIEGYQCVMIDQNMGREVIGHPLHVYTLIKRLVLYWPHINTSFTAYIQRGDGECEDSHPNCDNWAITNQCFNHREYMVIHCPRACHLCLDQELVSAVKELNMAAKDILLPSIEDLQGAALAISRLQQTYQIPISVIMSANIAQTISTIRLGVDDCLRVADVTRERGIYSYAIFWFKYCLTLANTNDPIDTNITTLIVNNINETEHQHDTHWTANHANFFRSQIKNSHHLLVPQDNTFAQVCRGVHKEIPESWHLRCYVSDRGSAFLRLRPVRMEQVHFKPELYIFYDVISDYEIAVIKNISMSKIQRSTVSAQNVNNKKSSATDNRVSATAWLTNATHPVIMKITQRIAHITALHVFEGDNDNKAGEFLQVLNYGIGGHYVNHMDLFFKDRPLNEISSCYPVVGEHCDKSKFTPGDRMATLLFYLSDVTAGGRTGFHKAGISVAPVRGSAVFWYNLRNDGQVDIFSQHGGCPVLMGQKWVANKWIREHKNFLRRPCISKED